MHGTIYSIIRKRTGKWRCCFDHGLLDSLRRRANLPGPIFYLLAQYAGEYSGARSKCSNILHIHLAVRWTERCSGRIEPFAARMSCIATPITDVLDSAGILLFAWLEGLLTPLVGWSLPWGNNPTLALPPRIRARRSLRADDRSRSPRRRAQHACP